MERYSTNVYIGKVGKTTIALTGTCESVECSCK